MPASESLSFIDSTHIVFNSLHSLVKDFLVPEDTWYRHEKVVRSSLGTSFQLLAILPEIASSRKVVSYPALRTPPSAE